MKKTKFILTLLVYALASEPVLSGKRSANEIKSFSAKCKAIERQLQGIEDELLNRPLRGRKRIDLLSSIEDDCYQGGAENELLRQLKDMVIALEDDAVMALNGNLNIRAFRQHVKTFKKQLYSLKLAFGAARKRSTLIKTFRPNMNPIPPDKI